MSDANRKWVIEHAGEQLYDIISSLDYDETSVKIWDRPRATRQPSNKRMARDFRDAGGRRANSRAGFVSWGFDDPQLQHTAVNEPTTTVAHDVRRIVESPVVSKQINVSGYGYDVKTGLLTQVVGATRAGAGS